jgi:MtN3 and saliva related transmembrane protein
MAVRKRKIKNKHKGTDLKVEGDIDVECDKTMHDAHAHTHDEDVVSMVLGFTGGILCSLSGVPQLVKLIQTQNGENVSLRTYVLSSIGLCLSILYGIRMHLIAIYICNSVGFLISFGIVMLKLKLQRKIGIPKDPQSLIPMQEGPFSV